MILNNLINMEIKFIRNLYQINTFSFKEKVYHKLKEKEIEEFNKNGTRFKNTLGYQFLRGRYFKEYEKN